MAKLSDSDIRYYTDRCKEYNDTIQGLLKYEEDTLAESRANPSKAAILLFDLSDRMCDLASNYLAINDISIAILDTKSEENLDEARKSLYKAIIYLENIVTAKTDAPFNEYETNLAELKGVDARRRFALVRKLGLAINLLQEAYGSNSKWKWSFVDMEGRTATVTKNIFQLDQAKQNMQPGAADQDTWVNHFRLIMRLLENAADRYIQRYQLSTKRGEDIRKATHYMGAAKYLYGMFGDPANAEKMQKKYDVWDARLRSLPVAER
jgi:hypothetical protein